MLLIKNLVTKVEEYLTKVESTLVSESNTVVPNSPYVHSTSTNNMFPVYQR